MVSQFELTRYYSDIFFKLIGIFFPAIYFTKIKIMNIKNLLKSEKEFKSYYKFI